MESPGTPFPCRNDINICITKSCDWAAKKLAFIELSVVFTVFAAATLVVFGSFRRRCSNSVFNIIQFVNYYSVTTLLVTFTIGQMVGAPFQNGLFAVWGLILLLVIGCPDCFSAYSPTDNEQWKSYRVQVLVQSILVGILVVWTTASLSTSSDKYDWLNLALFLLLATNRPDERAAAMKMATKSSLAQTTKYIADFMAREHEIPINGEPDPTQMKGYHYLVSGDTESKWTAVTTPRYDYQLKNAIENDEEIVTLHKIWQFSGSLLTGKDGQQLKDICLSFALYRLLCRRFGGHPFLESRNNKTWRFVRHGLLSEEGDYKRAFRVIEVELSFLFDLFYTKYAVIFQNGHGFINKLKFLDAVLVSSSCVILLITLKNYVPSNEDLNLVTTHGRSLDKLATGIIVVLILFMEIAQLLLLVVSDWVTVLLISNYVREIPLLHDHHNYLMFWKKIVILCQELFKPWERKLGQYSLLKSFNQNPLGLKFKCLLTWCSRDLVNIPRAGLKGSTRIKLPEEVKEAVIISLICLKRNDQPCELSNGEESLRRNGVWNEHLSSACRLETTTHVILVWHVATSLCMIDESTRSPTNSVKSRCFIIASSLSGYCSYLVAFAPRLICDNPIVCEFIFDKVIKEARQILRSCKSESEMHKKIMDSRKEETIIYRGAELAEELLHLPNGKDKWKVLADFWAELMLFLAPSGDPMAHVEHLARGGEFVTHLWALLSHAGILNQGSTSHDV